LASAVLAALVCIAASGCSGETANADASKACSIESEAQQIYDSSLAVGSQAKSEAQIAEVESLIAHASAFAARASEESGIWQPLAATLDSPTSVSIPILLSAATRQCEANL
jgi:hypothetical protein